MNKIIKTTILTGALSLMVFNPFQSKAQVFSEGKMFVSVAYGIPNISKELFSTLRSNNEFSAIGMGPFHGKFEYGITDKIGIGVSLNYVSSEIRWTDGNAIVGYDYSALAVNARINFHFLDHEKVDLYYGFGFGYNNARNEIFASNNNSDWESLNIPTSPVGFETTLGLRYMFVENFGAYTELGWAKSLLQIGLVGRF